MYCESRAVHVLLLAITLLCAGLAPGCGTTGRTESPYVVPLYGEGDEGVVKDQYFVIVKNETSEEQIDAIALQIKNGGGEVPHEYAPPVRGLGARIPPDVLTVLRRDAAILYIEADQVVKPTGVQTCAPWNLDRIDQYIDQPPYEGNGVFAYSGSGEGVRVYVLDTGVDKNHPELTGRVEDGTCKVSGEPGCKPNDYAGHGTHVAGIVAGTHFGVAKKAKIVPVRVFPSDNCEPSGSSMDVADGLDWVLSHEQQNQNAIPLQKTVAVLGLGTGFGNISGVSTIIGKINALTAHGIVVVVPAGNDGGDACNFVPGGQNVNNPNTAITVGAITKNLNLLGGSNGGPCVDIFAPGHEIVSSFFGSCSGGQMGPYGNEKEWNGTSQAAAHVAGVAAVMLGEDPTLSPANLEDELKDNAVGQVAQSGSLGGVVRLVPNSGGSGDQDADGCTDWLPANSSAPYCDNNVCCSGIDESCGGSGITCTNGECSLCGSEGYPCCNNDVCAAGNQCKDSYCEACGGPEEPCCGGMECEADLVCNGSKNCSCGNAGEPCCADGGPECYDPLDCGAVVAGFCGTCGGPTELCCGGPNGFCTSNGYTCGAYGKCALCGNEGDPCCKDGGDECFGTLECTGGTCQLPCGAQGEPCCAPSQCDASLVCNAAQVCSCGNAGEPCCMNGGPACFAPFECTAGGACAVSCGAKGEPCCDQGGCDASLTCNSNGVCTCGNLGEPCCQDGSSTCNNQLGCDSSGKCASCGGIGEACCSGGPLSCVGGSTCYSNVCTQCGDVEGPCCSDLPSCDSGATCVGGLCSFVADTTCWVRCSQGYLIYNDNTADDSACLTWSISACDDAYGSPVDRVRVSRNGAYIWDRCEGNGGGPSPQQPGYCGGVDEPCRLASPRCDGASCKYAVAQTVVNGIQQSSKQWCP